MQDGPILRDVDLLAAKHGVDLRSQAGFLGQLHEKLERLIGDPLLRVVEKDAGRFSGHSLTALRVVGEKRA